MPGDEKYNPLKNEIFLPIPIEIATRKDLKKISMLVYGYLLKCLGVTGKANPKITTMATDLKRDKKLIKTALSELESLKLIKREKVGRSNQYSFLELKGGDCLPPLSDTPENEKGETVSPLKGDNASPYLGGPCLPLLADAPYKDTREFLKESEKKPPADFLKKLELWRSIPLETRKGLNKKQVVKCSIEKIEYAIERMNVAINKGGDPVKAFQNALKGDHAKLTRKMESKAMAEKNRHDQDIIKLAQELERKKAKTNKTPRDTLIKLAVAFKESEFGEPYRNYPPLAIIELKSFQNWKNHARR